ncbi:MAG: DNA-processing protein DprA [Thermodesulfobacteriaceae bacterium]|nr:DNA-processing protein DprA [Thermodesulfobacteriaceae bacterium]MCX8041775.1 DNA-processing protein DprA [Thermodesulfobacteriaceae bacterium]MDW8136037.1 DNA-processing protein DprA [Thermodesulfobacterium sp.]
MDEKLIWLGIYLKEKNFLKLIKFWENRVKISQILKERGLEAKELIQEAEKEVERAKKEGIEILFYEDLGFPEILRKIPYPPLFLYVKGCLNLSKPLLAIVGSRKPTSYGKEVAYQFANFLGKNGVGIISGLARGIDTIAHKGCLEAEGYTVGVLGCGLNVVYPAENRWLYLKIIEKGGALISEHPLGTKPRPENFPRRNRLISGLSQGVLIIEAGKRSGTLITAKWALSQGKEVFAVPGNIFSSQSEGTHYLLKEGATLITNPSELMEYLGWKPEKQDQTFKTQKIELLPKEKEILNLITNYPKHIEEITSDTSIPFFEILSILTELEIKGLIKSLPGKYYQLVKI